MTSPLEEIVALLAPSGGLAAAQEVQMRLLEILYTSNLSSRAMHAACMSVLSTVMMTNVSPDATDEEFQEHVDRILKGLRTLTTPAVWRAYLAMRKSRTEANVTAAGESFDEALEQALHTKGKP